MRHKKLIRKIQKILMKNTPIYLWAGIRDSRAIPRREIHLPEAKEIAGLLGSSQYVSQLQKGIYDIFVQHNEYAHDFEKVKKELEGGEPSQLEHTHPGLAGKLEDYTTIAQEVFALKR